MKFSDLTEHQRLRLVYGAVHEILRQTLDNGDLVVVDYGEFLPTGFHHDSPEGEMEFNNDLQVAIEGTVMSDLFEESAKHDI
jgi:hypothetical protein